MLSRDARLMLGITLLTVPTIVYGGLTVLGAVTHGAAGMPAPGELTAAQLGLYRAGHAHAGVLLLLSLILQLALDSAALGSALKWVARATAPAAAILVSAGFFGLAHAPALKVLLYLGALCVAVATISTGAGLLLSRRLSALP